ncbi:MAG: tetratricopeptide repeat protein [Lachnospiraceae bacterium]|nr:tetratricopeptide repeat protein [Lachnospiraceae bacterium]
MSGGALSGERPAETRMLHSSSDDDCTEEIYIDETGPDVDVRQASLARLVVHAAGHVTGAVSLTFMRRTLSAMTCMQRQWGVSAQAEQAIAGLLGRCEEAGDREQVLFISAKLVLSAEDQEVLREIYDRQEGGRNLSPEDQYLLCLALGNAYASQGKKEAAPILERAMELAVTDEQKMSVCHVCAQYYTLIGDLRQEIRWCEDGYAIFLASGERQPVIAFQLTTLLCGIYITQHRTEEAKEILSRMEKTIRTLDLPCLQIPYQAVKGQLAIVTGNPAGGAEIFKEVLKMTFVYNGVKDGLYYSFLQELGSAYRLNRQHAEAEACYQDCVEFWKQAGNPFQVLALQNNIGALYQNWGKLTEAASTLEQAYHTAEQIKNDRQRGIIAGNLSKVCRELGESEKEYFYLKEASPLLDQIYGPQDATSVEARRRLQELEGERSAV